MLYSDTSKTQKLSFKRPRHWHNNLPSHIISYELYLIIDIWWMCPYATSFRWCFTAGIRNTVCLSISLLPWSAIPTISSSVTTAFVLDFNSKWTRENHSCLHLILYQNHYLGGGGGERGDSPISVTFQKSIPNNAREGGTSYNVLNREVPFWGLRYIHVKG